MSGFCYEHSPAEGQPIANITDYVSKNLYVYIRLFLYILEPNKNHNLKRTKDR